MYHVPFLCPDCQHSTDAPLAGIIDGDAGIWVCDVCGRVYQIQIEFTQVPPPRAMCFDQRILERRFALEIN